MLELNYAGQNVVLTGASSGIGLATLKTLAAFDCNIVAGCRRQKPLEEILDTYSNVHFIKLDLGIDHSIAEFAQEVLDRMKVDVLFNIAGYIHPARLEDTSVSNWQMTMDVNVNGPFHLYQWLYKGLAEGARVVNVSSLAGVSGVEKFPGFGAYTVSKMALGGLTETMAAELKDKNGRANAICPGAVDTPMLKEAAPGLAPAMTPEDVARHLLFYGSEVSFPSSGQVIPLV